jgi:hypothetical protein
VNAPASRLTQLRARVLEIKGNSTMAPGIPRKENAMFDVNLDQLPPTGAIIIAAPLKIADGSGSPLRVIALAPA